MKSKGQTRTKPAHDVGGRTYVNLCLRMSAALEAIYDQLFSYCKTREFAGHDPFDGLNSMIFRATPLKHFRIARFGWQQVVKRSPLDLRRILGVRSGINPKTLALFALAELSRYRSTDEERHVTEARHLLDQLLGSAIIGNNGRTAAFGYNFDWQSRSFFLEEGTPAIVPTAFVCRALVEGHEALGDARYLSTADAICRFILTDLKRPVDTHDKLCFSYTPIDQSRVFNASLLAGECLAGVGAINDNAEYLSLAEKTVRYVVHRQRGDGAWVYGEGEKQGWVDNFHTAYVLLSIRRISEAVPDLKSSCYPALKKGVDYWIDHFFLDDGTPRYYDDDTFPVDIHSAASAVIALAELRDLDDRALPLAGRVADWTVANMRDAEGFFFYRKTRRGVIRTPYMRWGQAWMAYALATLIEAEREVSVK